ncbi:MAG TPA: hypothetical protein VML55_03790 [Planctomycetaceae bacterium]|nr:hypothetical protein [Planctomycetaceae bacterium]
MAARKLGTGLIVLGSLALSAVAVWMFSPRPAENELAAAGEDRPVLRVAKAQPDGPLPPPPGPAGDEPGVPLPLPPANGEEEPGAEASLMDQTEAEAQAKSRSCLHCHNGIEKEHESEAVRLGCVDCHGGDPDCFIKEGAHVLPRFPDIWQGAGNPRKTFAILNQERPEFVRFINPGDWRVVHLTCGTAGCHPREMHTNRKSIMGHSAMVPGSALYNNGAVPNKIYRYGEVYGWGGVPMRAFSNPMPTIADVRDRGVLPWIDPVPRWEITQPDFRFRVLEINNNATSKRGPGTDARIDGVFLNVQKTKLNDPTMPFLGMNNNPGDYRSSGCTACHMLYANDRNPMASAHIAEFGNRGFSYTDDPTIPRDEPGHPIKHKLTRAIPSSQCMTCHFHQGSGALGNFLGYVWWDYETGAEEVYSRYGGPRPGGLVGPDWSPERHDLAPTVNPHVKGIQFADWHNNSWLYRAVYKRDRKGNLVDGDGQILDENDPDWHKKAVHLADIHAKKGMHCVDCHFEQDVHGDGRIYGAMIDPVEIACQDCHGTIYNRAELITSNPSGGNDLRLGLTSFGERRFYERDGKIFQRSSVTKGLEWEVVQVLDAVSPGNPHYSEQARLAKTLQRDGRTWGYVPEKPAGDSECKLAHSDSMTCYACHSSWNTSCGGCHLSAHTNVMTPNLHWEGEYSKAMAFYNPQVLRDDSFYLGINGTVQGNRVSPLRAASGVIVSVADGNRATVVHQQQTLSAEGYSGHAFSPNPPHTVGGPNETRRCTDCHISADGDNNAIVAQVMGLGVRSYDFVGRYAWVATGEKGISAVKVTTDHDFPTPVMGGNLHRIVDPEGYLAHYGKNKGVLQTAYTHKSKNARSIVKFLEWVFIADGPGGFRVFDIANIHNKDVAQRIVTSLIAPKIGQVQDVPTKYATCIAVASINPIDPTRKQRPENEEQPVSPVFGYAYVTDLYEGLIIIGIGRLADGLPDNNFLKRDVTFNPDGILCGATKIKIWGNHAYILTQKNGLVVVDISDPLCPRIVGGLGAPDLMCPTAIDFQFRYAFICDSEGLKVVDITYPEHPMLKTVVPFADARDVWLQKTYAYVAAGKDGLAIVDVERPELPGEVMYFNPGGCINDATAVITGIESSSYFAYVADGCNGLRVIQLRSPAEGSQVLGFSPRPVPQLIATYPTAGPAIAISPGMPRDLYVDIDGNQVGVIGRRGSRPFNWAELRRMFLRDGQVYTVTNEPPTDPVDGPGEEPKPRTLEENVPPRPVE